MTQSWAVARIFSKRALPIQQEVQRGGYGTYMPIMRSKRIVDGKLSDTPRPAFPGYMFVFGSTGSFYARDERTIIAKVIGRVSGEEYQRVRDDNAAGRHDEVTATSEAAPTKAPKRERGRKSRPSRRIRRRLKYLRGIAVEVAA